MGTDIFGVMQVQCYNYGNDMYKWENIPLPEFIMERDYAFFAAIGNVRNGHGVAGIKNFEPLEPLSNCRGVPDDFIDKECLSYGHSSSYITLKDLEKVNLDDYIVEREGYVSEESYRKYKQTGHYVEYCGMLSGHNIVKLSEEEYKKYQTSPKDKVYIKTKWKDDSLRYKLNKLKDFMNLYRKWYDKTGERVRFVFDFDC